jgi:outer membrane protein assembly factor BamB
MVTQQGSQSQRVNRSAAHKRRLSASVALLASLLLAASGQLGAHTVTAQASSREATSVRAAHSLSHGDALSTTIYLPTLLRQQPAASPTPTTTPTASPTPTATPTGQPPPPSAGGEWSQHAHNAQRTGYTSQVVNTPWRWRWSWNGPNSTGGISAGKTGLPRNVQPVTGGGRVYVAAGSRGVYALRETDGSEVWNARPGGNINSTVAYDKDTQSVFAVSSNGTLYKLNAGNGSVIGQFPAGASSALPLPPAVLSDRVVFAMGNRVFAVNKANLQQIWVYDAGAVVETPPSYSASRNRVIVGTADLHVHAIENSNGSRAWRMRPVHSSLAAGETPDGRNFAEFKHGWPVIADGAGYALIKVRLDWESLWKDWPQTNSGMRAFLTNNPTQQALFVLDLDDGSVPYIANVGHGGYGDSGYLPMGPQPVVKRLPNGKEIVYIIIRAKHAYDPRWDSHFGEMVLDNATVSGLQGGDVRFIAFDYPPGSSAPFLLTDEQPNVSMAGDYLFGGHWEAGFAMRILDRSDGRGSFGNKITSQRLDTIATSQDAGGCSFSTSHYCPSGLQNTREYDFGFYIYYRQGAVYDRYWGEYSVWVVSNDNLYFRSTDGAIVALTSGSPTTAAHVEPTHAALATLQPPQPAEPAVIPHAQAREWAGHLATVEGTLRYVFNNGKHVLLGFAHPHQGAFKVLIRKEHWPTFGGSPEERYRVGDHVRVTGLIEWYQGDPAIYAASPAQISTLAGDDQ